MIKNIIKRFGFSIGFILVGGLILNRLYFDSGVSDWILMLSGTIYGIILGVLLNEHLSKKC